MSIRSETTIELSLTLPEQYRRFRLMLWWIALASLLLWPARWLGLGWLLLLVEAFNLRHHRGGLEGLRWQSGGALLLVDEQGRHWSAQPGRNSFLTPWVTVFHVVVGKRAHYFCLFGRHNRLHRLLRQRMIAGSWRQESTDDF